MGPVTQNPAVGRKRVCRTGDNAIRITTSDTVTSSHDFPGLVQAGDTSQTPGFDDADVRIELDASANAGSIALDPEGGCIG